MGCGNTLALRRPAEHELGALVALSAVLWLLQEAVALDGAARLLMITARGVIAIAVICILTRGRALRPIPTS